MDRHGENNKRIFANFSLENAYKLLPFGTRLGLPQCFLGVVA
jgi:hypothetical protein